MPNKNTPPGWGNQKKSGKPDWEKSEAVEIQKEKETGVSEKTVSSEERSTDNDAESTKPVEATETVSPKSTIPAETTLPRNEIFNEDADAYANTRQGYARTAYQGAYPEPEYDDYAVLEKPEQEYPEGSKPSKKIPGKVWIIALVVVLVLLIALVVLGYLFYFRGDKNDNTLETTTVETTTAVTQFMPYTISVSNPNLPIYSSPSYDSGIIGEITDMAEYTVLEEYHDENDTSSWARLLQVDGWVNLHDAMITVETTAAVTETVAAVETHAPYGKLYDLDKNLYGKVNCHGGKVDSFSTAYVFESGSREIIKSSMGEGTEIVTKRACYNYGNTYYECYNPDTEAYYGWIDANYVDFYANNQRPTTTRQYGEYYELTTTRHGQVNCHGGTVESYTSNYVCYGDKKEVAKGSMLEKTRIITKAACYNYGNTYYECYSEADESYYGWIDEDYLDFDPEVQETTAATTTEQAAQQDIMGGQ